MKNLFNGIDDSRITFLALVKTKSRGNWQLKKLSIQTKKNMEWCICRTNATMGGKLFTDIMVWANVTLFTMDFISKWDLNFLNFVMYELLLFQYNLHLWVTIVISISFLLFCKTKVFQLNLIQTLGNASWEFWSLHR